MSQLKVNQWLEKMNSTDKDFRFMAVNDLLTAFRRGYVLEDTLDLHVSQKLLELLKDRSPEVQNLAMQCFAPLLEKGSAQVIAKVASQLCKDLKSDNPSEKDVAALTLKGIVKEPNRAEQSSRILQRHVADGVSGVLTDNSGENSTQLALDCLDILYVQLQYAQTVRESIVTEQEGEISQAIQPHLFGKRAGVRKRATMAASYFMAMCSDDMNALFITRIIATARAAVEAEDSNCVRSMIQCLAIVSNQAGHRLSAHIPPIMETLFFFSQGQGDTENVEFVVQAFEALIRKCPREMPPFLEEITARCLKFLAFDPNYNYGDLDEEDMDDGDEDDDEEEVDYSDDEDVSWKVRRASAKCLNSLIASRRDMNALFYKTISPVLISRFKEREENVKVDIFGAFEILLSTTKPVPADALPGDVRDEGAVCLQEQSADLIKAVLRQMKDKSAKVRQACFHLFSKLVATLPGVLSPYIPLLIPAVRTSLTDSKQLSSNIKTDALQFLRTMLGAHKPQDFEAHVLILVPSIVAAIDDNFYKTISEALQVVPPLCAAARPVTDGVMAPVSGQLVDGFIKPLFNSIMKRLLLTDIDQEVKENALMAMAWFLHYFADTLNGSLQECLKVYIQRLENEVTRTTAIKAVAVVAQSPLKPNISNPSEIVGLMSSFLRKKLRTLVLATLHAANPILAAYHSGCTSEMMSTLMVNCVSLVSSGELHVSQLALVVMTNVAVYCPAALDALTPDHVRSLVTFPQSPLVQGGVLNSFATFLERVSLKLGSEILNSLQGVIASDPKKAGLSMHRQCYYSYALCSASLLCADAQKIQDVSARLLATVQSPDATDSSLFYALITLGQLGKSNNLEFVNIPTIVECFKAESEEVKIAASVCLGLLGSGNPGHFIPFILNEISGASRHQYLLLHSLREAIATLSANEAGIALLQPFIEDTWILLFSHCESSEEGTRNMVAECLGKLTLIDHVRRLPILQARLLESATAVARATVITAVRFTISDQVKSVDALLIETIGDFLNSLQDPDENVRRVTLLLLNSVAHNKPSLIVNRMCTILPLLYQETVVRKELIREVEMGPFKHSVDDGLDIRKAAYECMYTLLESCLEKLDIFVFLSTVENGMKDHFDIKMLTYLMIVRLVNLSPMAVFQRLTNLITSLKTTISSKAKPNAVKQELEKLDELKRSAMRCIVSLLTLADAGKNPSVCDVLQSIHNNNELTEMFNTMQKKVNAASAGTPTEAAGSASSAPR